MKIAEMKAEQHETELEALEELTRTKLDALFQELQFIQRTTALTADEGTGVVVDTFNSFVAGLAIDTGRSREAFLVEAGEAYDEVTADTVSTEDDEAGVVTRYSPKGNHPNVGAGGGDEAV
jgi:hypothetical protein